MRAGRLAWLGRIRPKPCWMWRRDWHSVQQPQQSICGLSSTTSTPSSRSHSTPKGVAWGDEREIQSKLEGDEVSILLKRFRFGANGDGEDFDFIYFTWRRLWWKSDYQWPVRLTIDGIGRKAARGERRPFRLGIRLLRRLIPILAEGAILQTLVNFPVNSRPKIGTGIPSALFVS
jgi:hypothetical protein